MTTALRLPDPFTPDTTNTAAATPTCCCCCCCAASATGAAIALPTGLANDLADAGRPRAGAALVVPAALYPPGLLVLSFTPWADPLSDYAVAGGVTALLWAFLAAWLTGAKAPWRGPLRLLFWCGAFLLEVALALPLLAVPGIGPLLYLALVVGVGVLTHRAYTGWPR